MKAILAGLGSLILGVSLSVTALAQEQIPPPQYAPQAQEVEGPQEPLAPVVFQAAYPYPTVAVGGVPYPYPYPYAYAPRYGWGRSVAPRGWGGYRYDARIARPWHAQPWHDGRVAHPRAVGRGSYGGRSAHRR